MEKYSNYLIGLIHVYSDTLAQRAYRSTALHEIAMNAERDAAAIKAKEAVLRQYYQKHIEEQENLYSMARTLLNTAIARGDPNISALAVAIISAVREKSIY